MLGLSAVSRSVHACIDKGVVSKSGSGSTEKFKSDLFRVIE
jgi:hypothetical protein